MTQHRQHSSPSHVNLLNEQTRLETFHNWPMTATLEPEKLARGGFFYIGPQDRVRCIFCGGVLKSWQPTDDPFIEHQRYFAQCPFINGEDVGNIPIEGSSVVASEQLHPRTYHPSSPHYNTMSKRLETFHEWPSRATQNPEKLAEAGFFYCGVDDAVRCFFCDGGLRNWTPSDDPWVEHARWFPRCPYLQEKKGSDFVASILQRFPQTQLERRQAHQWAPQTPAQAVPAQGTRETMAMKSEAVQEVLKMGFDPTRVLSSVQQLMTTTGGQLPSLAQLLDKLLQEDNVRSVQGRREIEPVSHHSTSGSGTNILPSSEVNLDPASDRILCKICMDNQVEMTFLPCGHLICCASCARNAHTCPMCRRPVRASIRTYLC